MPHDNARLVADLLDAWNAHDVEGVVTLYAPDYEGVDVGEAAPQRGIPGIREHVEQYLSAFPDLEFTREETVVQDDRVALSWTARGTHRGPLMRIPPTGRPVTLHGIMLLTVQDRKVTRGLYMWDVAGLLRGIGLLPEL